MKQVVLYNHNKTTYENIARIFENDNKCAAVQPTGSGKSFLIFKLAQDNSDKTVVVFEPNKQIIGRVTEQMKEYDIDNIQFYTYQKLNSQYKRDEITIDNVDYICLDELHRIKAKQWNQAVDAIRDKFPNAKVLGLTATPERMDGQNIVDYFGAELACNITLGDAIVNKILPCPTYISALYTFDEEVQRVYDKINESRNSDEEKEEMRVELETARKQLENALGVPKILEKHIPNKNGKYIVFCQNVEHLNTMQSVIKDWFISAGFEIHTYLVHTKNPNRKTEYKEFQTDNSDCIKLCLCVDMFNEGVHLEGITGVILLRPTQSNIIYFQQIGRAISASDENIPIIFDLVNNGNCLGGGNLRIEIESVIDGRKENEKSNIDKDVDIFDIGDFHIYDYITESLNVFNNIENKCEDEFDFRLKQLEEYKTKWGHCCVMKEEAQEWDGLNNWATNQRNCKSKGKLSQDKINLLTLYNFVWDVLYWNLENTIQHIQQYLNSGNNLPIPSNYVCDDGFTLGVHLSYLKLQKKKGKINKNIEEILMNLGVDLEPSFEKKWISNYNITYEWVYILNNQICHTTKYKNFNIGKWAYENKKKYDNNQLSQTQKQLFDNIYGYCKTNKDKWRIIFDMSKEYLDVFNQPIKYQTKYRGYNIGSWLSKNKEKYRKGELSKEKEILLKKLYDLNLNIDEKRNQEWNNKYKLLKEYVVLGNKINHTFVYKGINLGWWYNTQIQLYKKGVLQEERVTKLKLLGLLNFKHEEQWELFIILVKKCLNNGVVINTRTIYDGNHIGQRLQQCRQRYKHKTFPKERYQQLLDLGIDIAKEGSLM